MAMMATVNVSLRGTPHEWYFRAKELIRSGEMDEKEVNVALSALIAGSEQRSRNVSVGEASTPSWSEVCHCMIRGWLSCREVSETMRLLVESKRCFSSHGRPRPIVPTMRNRHGGKDGKTVLSGDEEGCQNNR